MQNFLHLLFISYGFLFSFQTDGTFLVIVCWICSCSLFCTIMDGGKQNYLLCLCAFLLPVKSPDPHLLFWACLQHKVQHRHYLHSSWPAHCCLLSVLMVKEWTPSGFWVLGCCFFFSRIKSINWTSLLYSASNYHQNCQKLIRLSFLHF